MRKLGCFGPESATGRRRPHEVCALWDADGGDIGHMRAMWCQSCARWQVLGNQVAPLPALLPGSFLTCGVLYVLLLAAMISEKCARVPSLINAINFGDGTERARQHTVDYITSSGAGFFVFGVRLTTAMVAKFVYIWCIVAVGLLTKFASAGRG